MSFESIASTSDKSAEVFHLSEHDRESILTQIESSELRLPLPNQGSSNKYQELEALRRRELTLTLHASTLAEYIRAKRIPRGLRTHLTPNLLPEDTTFTTRWVGLCNQFSFDLMLLSIKHLQEAIDQCKIDIRSVEQEIRKMEPAPKVEAGLKSIEEAIIRLRESIMKVKLSKFARDTRDYENDKVYSWNKSKRRRIQPNPAQQSQQQIPFYGDTTGSESDGSTEGNAHKRSFLGLRKTVYNQEGGGNINEDAGPSQFHRPQTRAQRARGRGRPNRRR